MSLTTGTRLGPYEIVGQIGAGGMGEVYKAKDTRLDRTVAIKVLLSHLADNPDLKQRFEREARAISSLNHPHICILHDIGQQDGVDFLVMEYVEGEDLAGRLKKGPLPLDEALRYATQIADALDKAHRAGVVHRDLKPGNIMLTKAGAKLLDFGLAKLKASAPGQNASVLSALPTEEKPLTEKGSILGTLQYMAPEQLEGKEADARTDIFAFGTVLYEMVTGQKAFAGKSQASLISAIMSSEPQLVSKLQPLAPAALNHLVQSCLVKVPDLRRQSAHDLKLELEWIAGKGKQEVAPSPAFDDIRTGKKAVVGMIVTALIGAVVAGLTAWNVKPSAPQPVTRFALELPLDQHLTRTGRHVVALSPDGTHLVYVANRQLYIRAMDDLEARPIQGTEDSDPSSPFISPDGQWVGFWSGGTLKKVPVNGGVPVTLCEVLRPLGASWGPDDMILFGQNPGGIFRVRAAGGTPERLIEMEEGEIAHGPQMLSDGKTVLFTLSNGNWDEASIVTQSLETSERQVLIERGRDARFLPAGYLVFGRENNILLLSLDGRHLRPKGDPLSVVEGVMQSSNTGAFQFSVSTNGSLVYVPPGPLMPEGTLVRVDRRGQSRPLSAERGSYRVPRLSPDGQRLAVVRYREEDPRDIWILDPDRDAWTRLTFHPGSDTQPLWTPDGRFVYFGSNRLGGGRQIFSVPADGTGEAKLIPSSGEATIMPASWSPDGKRLAFHASRPETGFDIGILEVGEEKLTFILETPFNEVQPAFSPDGRFIAYVSDETGRVEVYVRSYPGPGSKVPISTGGGKSPLWSPGGLEIFYRSGDKMMVVPVTTRPNFTAGKPVVLFEGQFRNAEGAFGTVPEYNVTPDGQGFVMILYGADAYGSQQIRVVLNWFEELKRLVPTN